MLEATQHVLDTLGMDAFTVAERAGVHETSIYRRPLHMRALLTPDPIDPALPGRIVYAVLTALGTLPD